MAINGAKQPEDVKRKCHDKEVHKHCIIGCKIKPLRHSARNIIMEIGEAIKNPAYRIFQTEYSGCLDISAHA